MNMIKEILVNVRDHIKQYPNDSVFCILHEKCNAEQWDACMHSIYEAIKKVNGKIVSLTEFEQNEHPDDIMVMLDRAIYLVTHGI